MKRPLGLLPLASLALLACTPRPSPERIAGETMGTTYEVVVTHRPAHLSGPAIRSAVDTVLAGVNGHLSGWDQQSELARFNAADGTDWIPASALLVEAIEVAHAVSRDSGGAFDVTVSPLVRAWGFGVGAVEASSAPAPDTLERLRESVGYQMLKTRVSPPALRKTFPALHVDLDGIAPGLAVDRIAEQLELLGVRDYLVELGGEVRARGRSPAGRPWRVAVEAPLAGERRPLALVELDGMGVSTSGDYRDSREIDGRRISHTIDPRTAAPVIHALTSVTVLHTSAATADAWATALMVLGPVDGMALARREELAALFITRSPDGTLRESETPAFGPFAGRCPRRYDPAMTDTQIRLRRRPLLAPLLLPLLALLAAGVAVFALSLWTRTTVVILVRHAEAASSQTGDPDLSPVGESRVRGLGPFLEDALPAAEVDHLYAADTRRAQQTAASVANQFKLPINLLGSSDWDGLATRIRRDHRGATVVVVGYAANLQILANQLRGATVPLQEDDFGSIFVVVLPSLGQPTLLRLRYGDPPIPTKPPE